MPSNYLSGGGGFNSGSTAAGGKNGSYTGDVQKAAKKVADAKRAKSSVDEYNLNGGTTGVEDIKTQRNGQGEGKNPTMEEIWKALGFEDPEKAYEESVNYSDKTPSTVNPPKVGVDLSQKAIDAKIMNEKKTLL